MCGLIWTISCFIAEFSTFGVTTEVLILNHKLQSSLKKSLYLLTYHYYCYYYFAFFFLNKFLRALYKSPLEVLIKPRKKATPPMGNHDWLQIGVMLYFAWFPAHNPHHGLSAAKPQDSMLQSHLCPLRGVHSDLRL